MYEKTLVIYFWEALKHLDFCLVCPTFVSLKQKAELSCPCWNMSQQFQIIIIYHLQPPHLHSSMKGTPNSHRQNFIRLHLSVRFSTDFRCLHPTVRCENSRNQWVAPNRSAGNFWGFIGFSSHENCLEEDIFMSFIRVS